MRGESCVSSGRRGEDGDHELMSATHSHAVALILLFWATFLALSILLTANRPPFKLIKISHEITQITPAEKHKKPFLFLSFVISFRVCSYIFVIKFLKLKIAVAKKYARKFGNICRV